MISLVQDYLVNPLYTVLFEVAILHTSFEDPDWGSDTWGGRWRSSRAVSAGHGLYTPLQGLLEGGQSSTGFSGLSLVINSSSWGKTKVVIGRERSRTHRAHTQEQESKYAHTIHTSYHLKIHNRWSRVTTACRSSYDILSDKKAMSKCGPKTLLCSIFIFILVS